MACEGWRWMPGMLAIKPEGYDGEFCDGGPMRAIDLWSLWDENNAMAYYGGIEEVPMVGVPDLRDPATVGCLLALVREARGPESWAEPNASDLDCWALYSPKLFSLGHKTEAEALVAALEAAP